MTPLKSQSAADAGTVTDLPKLVKRWPVDAALMVTNAGNPLTNGIYLAQGSYKGLKCYAHTDHEVYLWFAGRYRWWISPARGSMLTEQMAMSKINLDGERGDKDGELWYYGPVTTALNNEDESPPQGEWKVHKGMSDAPTVACVGREYQLCQELYQCASCNGSGSAGWFSKCKTCEGRGYDKVTLKMVRCMQICCDTKANNNLEVKGAGVYRCSGTYKRAGQINGRPMWQHTRYPLITIFWSRTNNWWQISTYYFNKRDTELPHMTEWHASTPDYLPCPSIRLDNVDPAWVMTTATSMRPVATYTGKYLTPGMEEKTDDRTPGANKDRDNSDITTSSVPTPTTSKVEIIDWNVANFPSIPGVQSSLAFSHGRGEMSSSEQEGQIEAMEPIIET